MSTENEHKPVALITGITGFTGRYLEPALVARGYSVVGLDRHADSANHITCDLQNINQIREVVRGLNPVTVFHLAGISRVSHQDVGEIYAVNVVGTRNLLAALADQKSLPRSIVLASSATIYGNATVSPITEQTPPQPTNDYAVSKLAMEYVAGMWKEKLPIAIVRPFNYTGPGQSPHFVIPKIVQHFRDRAKRIELGSTDVVREYSDVRRVVEAYCRLADAGLAGETYNVSAGRGITLEEVLQLASELTGHQPVVHTNPQFVRENEVRSLVGSCEKLESAVGKLPEIPFFQTLRWMLDQ